MRVSRIIGLFVAVVFSACTVIKMDSQAEEVVLSREGVELPFSLSVGRRNPLTKMSAAVTQVEETEASFRGIQEVYIIPFKAQRAVVSTDARVGDNLILPQTGLPSLFGTSAQNGSFSGLVSRNNSHLYKNVIIPRGTASMLVYGQAVDDAVSVSPDSVAFKRHNGVLRKHAVEYADHPADISFTLEPFITAGTEAAFNARLNGLLSYLNSIAGATVSLTGYTRSGGGTWMNPYTYTQNTWTYRWASPATDYGNYADLKNPFDYFTNNGVGFSAGSSGLNQMLTTLYNSLYTLAGNTTAGGTSYRVQYYATNSNNNNPQQDYYYLYHLSGRIRELVNNTTYVTVSGSGANATVTLKSDYADFPASFGVPAGCVAIEWNGTQFVQQTAASGAALAAMDAYCYPPSLWYMANSTLRTSDESAVVEEYKSANTSWQAICDLYTYGTVVIPGAESAALKDPLHYGVAMLEVNLGYALSPGNTQLLLDSQNNAVDVRNDHFPLTGIIIGEQKDQEFNFTPSMSGVGYYVYDSEVNNGSTPKAYIAGQSSGLTFQPVHTLVVPTEDRQDIHMALEFQNNSGADFYGANGNKVAAGSRFYLIATLEYDNAVNNSGETISAVFVRDHVTRVAFKVQSLSKAYNTIPELRDPQLEMGVVTKIEWVQSTPAEIPMY